MIRLNRLRLTGNNIVIYNPHFWAIIFIIFIFSFIYYSFDHAKFTIIERHLSWVVWLVIFEFRYYFNGSLLYIPMIYAALAFWWRGILLFWLFSMAIILPHVLYLSANNSSLITNVFYLTVPVLVVGFITFQLRWRERERSLMAEREAERKTFISNIIRSQEDERKRIAGELHDDILQTLLAIANQVQELLDDKPNNIEPQTRKKVEEIRDLTLNTSKTVRRISRDLRPSLLDNLGLLSAIRWLVDHLAHEDDIDTIININGESRKLHPDTEVIVFRFVQEALNNIKKHSGATNLILDIDFGMDKLKVAIQDNGRGFSLPQSINTFSTKGKLGIIGMQEKANTIGGNFSIHSAPGKGTLVSMEVKA